MAESVRKTGPDVACRGPGRTDGRRAAPPSPAAPPLSDDLAQAVDRLCDRFEASWKAGERPLLEDYVQELPVPGRGALLRELVGLDVEYRRDSGARPTPGEYLLRFPAHADVIREVFDQPAARGVLQIRCPDCHVPIQVDSDAPLWDLTCRSCGRRFSLVNDDLETLSPERIGRFRIDRALGSGAFGSVWKAYDPELDRVVAVKVPRQCRLTAAETEYFLREARAAAQLRHPHIVSVHEVGWATDTVYIVSDYVEGRSLSDWLADRRLSTREAVASCISIAEAMHHAHDSGVIHRDLKPANILVDAHGKAYVTDFGLAKRQVGEITITVEGRPLGTPAYMPPEQAQGGAHQSDARSDVYSLGAIFFELLTGEPVFRGDLGMVVHQVLHDDPPSPRKLDGRIPRDLETICLKCLQKNPDHRYQTAVALADDLRRWQRHEPIRARPTSRLQRVIRWCRRRPLAATLLSLLVLVTSVGFAAVVWQWQETVAAQRERTLSQVEALVSAAPESVPVILSNLAPYRDAITPQLRRMLIGEEDAGRRLRLRLALLPDDPSQLEPLREQLLVADAPEFLLIRDALSSHLDAIAEELWGLLAAAGSSRETRLRAACCLAMCDSADPRWQRFGGDVAGILLEENPLVIRTWIDALRPVRSALVAPLAEMSRDADRDQTLRLLATRIVVQYTTDDPQQIVELLLEADDTQFDLFLEKLKTRRRAVGLLESALEKHTPAHASKSNDVAAARRQVNIVMALYRLGRFQYVWPLLKSDGDATVRAYLVHRIAGPGRGPKVVIDRLERERDASVQKALILGLGGFAEEAFDPQDHQRLVRKLLGMYRGHADAGIRGAAEWTLRRWQQESRLDEIDAELAGDEIGKSRQWYVNRHRHTMVVVAGPVEVELGEPETANRKPNLVRHTKRIPRSFAIAAKETTGAQFERFLDDYPEVRPEFRKEHSVQPDHPQNHVTWYQAAAYCRWLSEQEGIPPNQMCYPPVPEITEWMRLPEDYLRRTGYRLPTDAEWEYACRAGGTATFYCGDVDGLRDNYMWHYGNSNRHCWPVGSLKPNDFGLFDMLGNVDEWCQECMQHDRPLTAGMLVDDVEDREAVSAGLARIWRGGSMSWQPGGDTRGVAFPVMAAPSTGFRVARTVPEIDVHGVPPTDSGRLVGWLPSVLKRDGNPIRGGETFAAKCAECHQFRGLGTELGPDLAATTDKSAEALVRAVAHPSHEFDAKYGRYLVRTHDSRLLSGMIVAQTASISLVRPGGQVDVIPRENIRRITPSRESFMPDGLEKGLTPQQLSDLVAYLQRPMPPGVTYFANPSAAEAEAARQRLKAHGLNGLAEVVESTGDERRPSWLGGVHMSFYRQTGDASKLVWQTEPVPADVDRRQPYSFRMAAAMGYFSQGAEGFSLWLGDRRLLDFGTGHGDRYWSSPDGRVKMFFYVMEYNPEDAHGILQITLPGELLRPGEPVRFQLTGSSAGSQRWFGLLPLP